MGLIVQKFGGTSLQDPERIASVAERIAATRSAGHSVVAVVSAMAGETDRLSDLVHEVSSAPEPREVDVILSTGEQVATGLLALALRARGVAVRSLLGWQVPIETDAAHSRARIRRIDPRRIRAELEGGAVVVLPGFQGLDTNGDITTLGRGASDLTAVATAVALEADGVEIYTDVPGVFTSDPRVVPDARKLDRISYGEMVEMASLGARVLQIRSVKLGQHFGLRIHVRSTFSREEGTWVVPEEEVMERLVVSAVTHNRDEAKITLARVRDVPGIAAKIFAPISNAGIVVDVIVQNVSRDGFTDLTFTTSRGDLPRALPIVEAVARELGAEGVTADAEVAKVSVVGLGMKDHAGVAGRMFEALSDAGINIQMINTSEIKISVVVEEKHTELACRTLHDTFELGAGRARAEDP
ncbi:MAG: aspartate kinase [Myxococcota bacterium]